MYFSPESVLQLVYLATLFAGVIYLFSRSSGPGDTRRVATLLALQGSSRLLPVLAFTWKGVQLIGGDGADELPVLLVAALLLFLGSFVYALHVVYRLGEDFRPTERRVVVGVGIFLTLATTVSAGSMVVKTIDQAMVPVILTMIPGVLLACSLWMIVLLIRRLAAARKEHNPRQTALIRMVGVAMLFWAAFVVTIGTSVFPAEIAGAVNTSTALGFGVLLFLAVILYGKDQFSLQAKLVGFLVAVYMVTFAFTISIARPVTGEMKAFQGDIDRSSLAFAPDSLGGYSAWMEDSRWEQPIAAPYGLIDDGSRAIAIGFSFPFFGEERDSLEVGTNGALTFGGPIDTGMGWLRGEAILGATPAIAPLYADLAMLDPASGISVDRSDSVLVVTWQRVSGYQVPGLIFDFQALLHRDGRIRFNYKTVTAWPQRRWRGISPGGPVETVTFSRAQLAAAPGTALLENIDQHDAYLASVTGRSRPLAWLGFLGLFLSAGLALAFYRVGLLTPIGRVLAGLEEVEKGNLNTQIQIIERNELGAMADHFNTMTHALHGYQTDMERQVEERTAELRATQAQLVEQEKLASLGSLTAGIAHEIKNPLNFVNNFAEVNAELADELSEAIAKGDADEATALLADLRDNATQIAKHGKRADSIVRAMMQHARGGGSERETIEVNTFVEEYAGLAWHGMRARDDGFRAELVRELDPEAGSIQGMPQELGRVVLNLLNNAFDAVQETPGAVVRLKTERTEEGVRISVSDNGPGIPPEIRQKIFEPFFTTKPTGEGTGLGLSLSYDIVTKGHGGSMTVRDSPEGGAAFIIELPA